MALTFFKCQTNKSNKKRMARIHKIYDVSNKKIIIYRQGCDTSKESMCIKIHETTSTLCVTKQTEYSLDRLLSVNKHKNGV